MVVDVWYQCLLPLFLNHHFFIMAALWNRADHYIFALWFLSFSFFFLLFHRLISAVRDWMSTILPHTVWP